ncbi:MAG TPA: galactose oxidase early set domain-containing protein, partial [Gemmatimonadales bacterium]|nr:galactose oxidase early set domain-containing protein [Gemmatimonadales bacterium]
YLFKGTRPTYNLASTAVHYGQSFTVTTSDAASIQKVTLIRHSSTTHAFDAGQRLSTLSFTKALDGQSLTVTPPISGRIAPPGPYMLFIVNSQGVPSVAQSVLLSP